MTPVIRLGIATHLAAPTGVVAACGVIAPTLHTTELVKINCVRCRKTRIFKSCRRALRSRR